MYLHYILRYQTQLSGVIKTQFLLVSCFLGILINLNYLISQILLILNMVKHLNAHQNFKLIHLYYICFKMLDIHQQAFIKYTVGIDIT